MRFADVNLNEDEDIDDKPEAEDSEANDEEEVGDNDEFIDLLDVLDGKGDIDMGSDEENVPIRVKERLAPPKLQDSEDEDVHGSDREVNQSEEVESDESEGDNEGDEEEKMAFAPSDDDDPSHGALDELQNFISTLDPTAKKRKDPEDVLPGSNADTRSRKKRLVQERTEAGAENEFRVQSGTCSLF